MHLAVKLPEDLRQRLCSFPFLQTLVKGLKSQIEASNKELAEEDMDQLSVHLIAEKKDIEALYLLPFQAYYHELDQEDLKTVFSAHRAVRNLKIDSADIYLSLTESFVDASLGKSLGAKVKVGFGLGKNSFFYDRKASLLKGRHFCEQYHELLKLFLDNPPETPVKGFSRELAAVREDWSENPYYMVNLTTKEGRVEERWSEFFSYVDGETFILLCDGLPFNQQKEIIQDFIKGLGKNNVYIPYELESLIHFSKLVTYAQTFITEDSSLLHVAAYCGAHIHFLQKKEPLQKSGPVYFLGEVRYFNLNEPFYREGSNVAYHKVFDEIFKFIENKAKDREK